MNFNSKNNNVPIPRTADETKLWSSPSSKHRRNPCFAPLPMYQDSSTCHDWPVKNVMVDLPIKMKGNSKRSSCNPLSSLGVQNKDLVAPRGGGLPYETDGDARRNFEFNP